MAPLADPARTCRPAPCGDAEARNKRVTRKGEAEKSASPQRASTERSGSYEGKREKHDEDHPGAGPDLWHPGPACDDLPHLIFRT
jgi:hypothetical protein